MRKSPWCSTEAFSTWTSAWSLSCALSQLLPQFEIVVSRVGTRCPWLPLVCSHVDTETAWLMSALAAGNTSQHDYLDILATLHLDWSSAFVLSAIEPLLNVFPRLIVGPHPCDVERAT